MSFLIIYSASELGYFDHIKSRRVSLTNEQIQKFEQDVKDGKPIDLNKYLIEEDVDYSNSVTKAGTVVSETMNSIMTEGLSSVFEVLKKLFG